MTCHSPSWMSFHFVLLSDLKCLHSSKSPQDRIAIQEDLNIASHWSLTSIMTFNCVKNAVLHFWSSQEDSAVYTLNNILRNSVKDLGVMITTDLSAWTEHHKIIISKAYKSLGLIRHTFKTNNISVKKHLYVSMIRSQMMYCSQLWWPRHIQDILLLERVIYQIYTEWLYIWLSYQTCKAIITALDACL